MAKLLFAGIALLLSLVLVGGPLLDRYSRVRGTLPFLHWGTPFGFDFTDIPPLVGKTYVITGANSGLGFGSTKLAVQHGAEVVMVCRTIAKCEEAKAEIVQSFALNAEQAKKLVPMACDISSIASVRKFVNAYKATGKPIHSLILNAGIMYAPYSLSADNIESQFATNHVGHFALTKGLLSVVEKSQPATIVSVSSLAHWFTPTVKLTLEELNDAKAYTGHIWYANSKLANILFVKELNERLGPKSQVFVNAVHPGGVQGNLTRHLITNDFFRKVDRKLQSLLYWTEEVGALTVMAPAADPKVIRDNIRGEYFVPIGRVDPGSPAINDVDLRKKLWAFSEELLKKNGWTD